MNGCLAKPHQRCLKIGFLILLCLVRTISSSCQQKPTKSLEKDFQTATKNIVSWMTYEYNHINWYEFSKALNERGELLEKNIFFDSLITGRFIPLAVESDVLKLFPIRENISPDIVSTIINNSRELQKFNQKEGQTILPINFKDINGNEITKEDLAGKVIVFNCWFVHCAPCRAEMPELNRLVKDYSDNSGVIFISLCLDSTDNIKKFLQTTQFNYTHLPDQTEFIKNRFGISGYPTHVVIDKKFTIFKIVSTQRPEQIRRFIDDALSAN